MVSTAQPFAAVPSISVGYIAWILFPWPEPLGQRQVGGGALQTLTPAQTWPAAAPCRPPGPGLARGLLLVCERAELTTPAWERASVFPLVVRVPELPRRSYEDCSDGLSV